MIQKFEYVAPKNLMTLLKLLDKKKNGTKILAGGTDILPGFHIESSRFKNINLLVDIKKIESLKKIIDRKEFVEIGSSVTFSEIIESEIIQKNFPLLVSAAEKVGSAQIRNRATIVGNFVNNAPCADSVPPLLVYNASIELRSIKKSRIVSLEKFLLKPYTTAIKKNEVVTKIIIPKLNKYFAGEFYKLGRRRAVAISRISLAVLISIKNELIDEFRIASGAITPIGVRLHKIEEYAKGRTADEDTFKEISRMLGEEVLNITGLRWSSEYKIPVVQQLLYQLLIRLSENEKKSITG